VTQPATPQRAHRARLRCVSGAAIAITLPLLLLASCKRAPATRVILVGDSITRGSVRGGGASFAEGLADLLGSGYELVNAGCAGSSALDWTLSRPSRHCGGEGRVEANLFASKLESELPAPLVTLMLGTNDALAFHEPVPTPPDLYEQAMREIIHEALERGAGEIILMTPPPNPRSDEVLRERLAAYRDRTLAICGQSDRVRCGPDVFELLDAELHFEGPNAHPNATGHRAIAEALARSVRERS